MRILFLTPSVRLLGARQSLLALAERLPRDVEPLVVCPGRGGLADELAGRGVPVKVVPHGAWRKVGGRLRASFLQVPALQRIARGFRPDVIHCNEFHSTPQGVRTAAAVPGAAVTSHVRLSITQRQIANYLLPQCDGIAAVSEACREMFAGTDIINKVEVIYNGVDVSRFQTADRAAGLSMREQFGWNADEIVFCLLGLVSPRKNQMVAVEAIAEANRSGVPARLLLAGDPFKSTENYGEALRARIQQDDLRGKVQWLPFQRDVVALYAACDVNLLISSEEGFGRTIIEAGAMGIPSIGANTGGIPELIIDDESGWIVAEGSSEKLAEIMQEIHMKRERVGEFGDAARKRVEAHFTIEAHVERMRKFWERSF